MGEPINTHEDELADLIARDVRRHAHCQSFRWVTLHKVADENVGANWSIGYVNYGEADQIACDVALREVIPRMQRQYRLR